jgi:ankyrin repeat protein
MLVSAANLRHPKRRGAVIHQVFMAALWAKNGEFEVPQQFPVDTKSRSGGLGTLMNVATLKDDVVMLQQLVKRGAKFDPASVLHDVADGQCPNILAWLLDTHRAVLAAELMEHGSEFAVDCVKFGNLRSVQLLHGVGVDMTIKATPAEHCVDSVTPLQMAIMIDAVDIACWLLEVCPATAFAKTKSGKTCAVLAARRGHLTIVQALVRAGADMNARCCNGSFPLLAAAKASRWDVVRWLLQCCPGIIIHKHQRQRGAPVVASYAVRDNVVDVLQLLHAHQAPLHTRHVALDKADNTLLIAAANHGHVDVVRFLVSCAKMAAVINARDSDGCTAVHHAAVHGLDMLRALHDANANMCLRNHHERTIMHCAAFDGRLDVLLWALHTVPGLDGLETDIDGYTAADYARLVGNVECAAVFGAAVARVSAHRAQRWTPLRAAWCGGVAAAAKCAA